MLATVSGEGCVRLVIKSLLYLHGEPAPQSSFGRVAADLGEYAPIFSPEAFKVQAAAKSVPYTQPAALAMTRTFRVRSLQLTWGYGSHLPSRRDRPRGQYPESGPERLKGRLAPHAPQARTCANQAASDSDEEVVQNDRPERTRSLPKRPRLLNGRHWHGSLGGDEKD